MDSLDFGLQLGCVTELLLLPLKLIGAIFKYFSHELGWLFLALFASVLWVDYYDVSVLTMELNLLSKLGLDISYEIYEVAVIMGLYFVLICFRKISQWTRAALYGCVTAFVVSSVPFLIKMEVPDFQAPKLIVFVVVLISSVLFMRMGFHKVDNWITPDKEKLGLIVGIVPSLLYSFITICTLFTITFGEAVVNKFSYVIWTIILEIVLYGAGIFLYFFFNRKYMRIMMKKLGVEEETCVFEDKIIG